MVREFQATRYLSMSRAASISSTDDIGDVAEQVDSDETLVLESAVVVGMLHIDVYLCCLGCKARVEPLTPPLGKCTGCLMQRSNLCRQVTSAKLLLMYERDGKNRMMQCHAYDDILREMAGGNDISQESLLMAPRCDSIIINVKDKKTIKEVKRS